MNSHIPTNPSSDTQPKAAVKCPFARLFGGKAASLADALRERTKEAHARAEKHPLQARLVKGEATLGEYTAWLGQTYHLWRAVDAAIAKLASRDARIAAMVKPYHPHAQRVLGDLAHLGRRTAEFPAVPAASSLAMWLNVAAANTDPAVIGAWYVLEGSSNGGRFIAKAVSRSLGIPGPAGLTALDPHGEEQRARWAAWRADLDGQRWKGHEREAVIAAAERTFDAVGAVMEEMSSAASLIVVVPARSAPASA